MSNVLEQIIRLNTKDYSAQLKKVNGEFKDAMKGMKDGLLDSSKAFSQNESQSAKWGKSVGEDLRRVGAAFKDNLKTGAAALTLDLGRDAIKGGLKDAASMAVDASSKFAEMRSRISMTDKEVQKFQKSIRVAAIASRTDIGEITGAFADLSDVIDPANIEKFLDVLSQGAAINGGNGSGVSKFLKDTLGAQGKDFNRANISDEIGGVDLLRRNGHGFSAPGAAFSAFSGLDQASVLQSKLSPRELAGLLSGASAVGTAGQATSGIGDLLKANASGQLGILGSLFGGSLTDKSGKLNLGALGSSKAMGLTRLGHDENTNRAIFKDLVGQAGVSGEGAESLFKMVRGFDKVSEANKKTLDDQHKLSQSAEEMRDSIEGAYTEFKGVLVDGFMDIFKGLEQPVKDLFSGHVFKAIGGIPKAAQGAIGGVIDHPYLTGGALLGTAAGAMLLKRVLPGLFGKLGGGAAGLAGGLGMGAALSKMGVTPVYVVNAQEIAGGKSMSGDMIKDLLTGGGAAAGAGGVLRKAGGFIGKAGAAGLLGFGIDAVGNYVGEHGYAKTGAGLNVAGAALEYGATGAMIGSVVPGVGTAIGAGVGAAIGAGVEGYRIFVEVQDNTGRFSAPVSAHDLPRSSR